MAPFGSQILGTAICSFNILQPLPPPIPWANRVKQSPNRVKHLKGGDLRTSFRKARLGASRNFTSSMSKLRSYMPSWTLLVSQFQTVRVRLRIEARQSGAPSVNKSSIQHWTLTLHSEWRLWIGSECAKIEVALVSTILPLTLLHPTLALAAYQARFNAPKVEP